MQKTWQPIQQWMFATFPLPALMKLQLTPSWSCTWLFPAFVYVEGQGTNLLCALQKGDPQKVPLLKTLKGKELCSLCRAFC